MLSKIDFQESSHFIYVIAFLDGEDEDMNFGGQCAQNGLKSSLHFVHLVLGSIIWLVE